MANKSYTMVRFRPCPEHAFQCSLMVGLFELPKEFIDSDLVDNHPPSQKKRTTERIRDFPGNLLSKKAVPKLSPEFLRQAVLIACIHFLKVTKSSRGYLAGTME